ncbi:hypothetical protein P7C70_g2571, partial [Phenoliferia sp. Uapishka_3]
MLSPLGWEGSKSARSVGSFFGNVHSLVPIFFHRQYPPFASSVRTKVKLPAPCERLDQELISQTNKGAWLVPLLSFKTLATPPPPATIVSSQECQSSYSSTDNTLTAVASTTAEEQAYIDGTHPALQGNAQAMAELRSGSPTRSVSPSSSTKSSPRFSAVDDDAPTSALPPLNSNTRGASNTGPKGVLADYKARNNVSQTGPKGVLADFVGSQAASAASAMANLTLSLAQNIIKLDREESEEEDEDEAKAIERYRSKRLAEMSGSGVRGSGRGRKVFGHLREIGMDQFLTAIEDEDPEVAVVLHLYEPGIEACYTLNTHLSAIARAYPHTKFIRALATEVDFAADSEDDALPTVIVYRGGELESTLVRLDRDWGSGTKQEILDLLIRSKAISGPPAQGASSPGRGRQRRDSDSGDDDY